MKQDCMKDTEKKHKKIDINNDSLDETVQYLCNIDIYES